MYKNILVGLFLLCLSALNAQEGIPLDCENPECNIMCIGDFEAFTVAPPANPNNYFPQIGLPNFSWSTFFSVIPAVGAEVDPVTLIPNGNQYLFLWSRADDRQDGIYVPLAEPIEPGCSVDVSFEAGYGYDVGSLEPFYGEPTLRFYGLNGQPCTNMSTPFNCAENLVPFCPGVLGTCMTGQSFPLEDQGIPIQEMPTGGYLNGFYEAILDLSSYNFTWENQTNTTVTHLMLFTGNRLSEEEDFECFYFMDNIVVERNCEADLKIDSAPDQSCIGQQTTITYDLCLTGDGNTPRTVDLDLATLPTGTSIAGGDFDANGNATVEITPNGDCVSLTLVLDIDGTLGIGTQLSIDLTATSDEYCFSVPLTNHSTPIKLEACADPCDCTDGLNFDAGTGMTASQLGMPTLIEDRCISISGRLLIDDDYTWDNVEVIMNSGAEIEVNAWDLLTINESEIYGCETMWRGIVLNTSARLDMQDTEIRDAQYAITPHHQSRVQLLGNTFNANYVGVYSEPSATPQFFKPISNSLPWNHNTFQGTYDLLAPYPGQTPVPDPHPYAGIWLNDVEDGFLYFNDDGIPAPINFFTDAEYGIRVDNGEEVEVNGVQVSSLNGPQIAVAFFNCIDASVEVSSLTNVLEGIYGFNSELTAIDNNIAAEFQAIHLQNGQGNNATIHDNIIDARAGILAFGYEGPDAGANEVIIRDNQINARGTGISVAFCEAIVRVEDNPIFMDAAFVNGTGIALSDCSGEALVKRNTIDVQAGLSGNFGYGIYLENTSNSQIVDNGINQNQAPVITAVFAGIRVINSPNNLYCCNAVDFCRNGVMFDGDCNGTLLRNTTFGNHQTGLRYVDARTGTQENAGNDWSGANTLWDAVYVGNTYSVTASAYKVDPGLLPNGHGTPTMPNIVVTNGETPQDWFTFAGNGPSCTTFPTYCGEIPFALANESAERNTSQEELEHSQMEKTPQLSPNPAQGEVRVAIGAPSTRNLQLSIVDVSGKLLLTQQLPAGQTAWQISLDRLSPGLYFCSLKGPGDFYWSEKLVIVK